MEILRVENLSFKYPKAKEKTLFGIDLSVKKGEFIVLCGASGCGKTTLLKMLKKELTPEGEKSGRVLFNGTELDSLTDKQSAAGTGFVMQRPDGQIVTDKVWHEMAFGLENLGKEPDVIRRRVAETANYFGINEWMEKSVNDLSGGEKQILSLASVMVTDPELLLLDEPTGQLDPIAASEFLSALKKLNSETGVTVILAEHRLEEIFPAADRVMVMEEGGIVAFDVPRNIPGLLKSIKKDHPMIMGLPSAVRIFDGIGTGSDSPLTVREGRVLLEERFSDRRSAYPVAEYVHSAETAAEMKGVSFRYEKELPDVLKNTDLTVYAGERFFILGGNGSGKTTLLNVLSGLDRPYKGKIKIFGKNIKEYKNNSLYRNMIAYLPQDPQALFLKDSVYAELSDMLSSLGTEKEKRDGIIKDTAQKFGLSRSLDTHPYDLSGGEQQKCALAKILLTTPKLLLLDEPTKGLDAYSKAELKEMICRLKKEGVTVIAVTHDIEFAAENADRCGLFFDGEIVSADVPEKFFAMNNYYTTASSRIARGVFENAVTCSQVVAMCKGGPV